MVDTKTLNMCISLNIEICGTQFSGHTHISTGIVIQCVRKYSVKEYMLIYQAEMYFFLLLFFLIKFEVCRSNVRFSNISELQTKIFVNIPD